MAPAFEALIIFSGLVGTECVLSDYKHLLWLILRGKERQKQIEFHLKENQNLKKKSLPTYRDNLMRVDNIFSILHQLKHQCPYFNVLPAEVL